MSTRGDFELSSRERLKTEMEEGEKVAKAKAAFIDAMSDAAVDFLIENIKTADWYIGSKGLIAIHFDEMSIKKSLVDLVQEAITDSTNDEDGIESIKSTLQQCLDILKDR